MPNAIERDAHQARVDACRAELRKAKRSLLVAGSWERRADATARVRQLEARLAWLESEARTTGEPAA
jgi:hypothetical protein